jgi:hypothetical protein
MKTQERIGSCRRGNTRRHGCTDSHVAQTPEGESVSHGFPSIQTAIFELPVMAWNPGEPHGDASRGSSGPGRVFVGKLFGAFLRTGTGDAPVRRGNVTLRGRNRFATGRVVGGSGGVATRRSGLSVSGVGWRGDTPLRFREARRCRVTSFGRRARGGESGFLREDGVRVVARRIGLRTTSRGAGRPRGHSGYVGGTNL